MVFVLFTMNTDKVYVFVHIMCVYLCKCKRHYIPKLVLSSGTKNSLFWDMLSASPEQV